MARFHVLLVMLLFLLLVQSANAFLGALALVAGAGAIGLGMRSAGKHVGGGASDVAASMRDMQVTIKDLDRILSTIPDAQNTFKNHVSELLKEAEPLARDFGINAALSVANTADRLAAEIKDTWKDVSALLFKISDDLRTAANRTSTNVRDGLIALGMFILVSVSAFGLYTRPQNEGDAVGGLAAFKPFLYALQISSPFAAALLILQLFLDYQPNYSGALGADNNLGIAVWSAALVIVELQLAVIAWEDRVALSQLPYRCYQAFAAVLTLFSKHPMVLSFCVAIGVAMAFSSLRAAQVETTSDRIEHPPPHTPAPTLAPAALPSPAAVQVQRKWTDICSLETYTGGDWFTASCSAGRILVSGGCDAIDPPYVFRMSVPVNTTSYTCGGFGGRKTITLLCCNSQKALPVTDNQIVANANPFDSCHIERHTGGDWFDASCSANRVLISGGCDANSEPYKYRVAKQNDINTYSCGGHGGSKTISLLCCDPMKLAAGTTAENAHSLQLLPAITALPHCRVEEYHGGDWFVASCSAGYFLVSGGCDAQFTPHVRRVAMLTGINKYECGGHGGGKTIALVCCKA